MLESYALGRVKQKPTPTARESTKVIMINLPFFDVETSFPNYFQVQPKSHDFGLPHDSAHKVSIIRFKSQAFLGVSIRQPAESLF